MDLGPPTGFKGSHHGGPVVVSRRPRVACRAHGCSDDRVRSKHVAVNRGSHGAMTGQQSGSRGDAPLPQQVVDICAWRDALYGLRRVRVGEAPHPGPRRRRRVRSWSVASSWSGPDRTLLDDFERDLLASDIVRTVGTQIDGSSPQQWQACCLPNG